MSISVTENLASRRALDEIHAYEELAQKRKDSLREQFIDAARKCDMSASSSLMDGQDGDVLLASLDYPGGPSLNDVLEIVCRVAKGELVVEEASLLINRMADTWINYYGDES